MVRAFFWELFKAILQKKNRILIVTYITIGVSSGRESEEGEIVLRFKKPCASHKDCQVFLLYLLIASHEGQQTAARAAAHCPNQKRQLLLRTAAAFGAGCPSGVYIYGQIDWPWRFFIWDLPYGAIYCFSHIIVSILSLSQDLTSALIFKRSKPTSTLSCPILDGNRCT